MTDTATDTATDTPRIVADFAATYPVWRELDPRQASFDADVARETE